MRIACLHTAASNVAVFDDALLAMNAGDVALLHHVRADLLAEAERAGGLTDALSGETAAVLIDLARDADAVLLTCSTLCPAVSSARDRTKTPILRVDSSLAALAVRGGGSVVALCALETTLAPTRLLFEEAAAATGATVDVRLVSDAWTAFRSGNGDRYYRIVAAAADRAADEGADTVALAQASMAPAAALAARCAPLTSPASGLAAAIAAARDELCRGRACSTLRQCPIVDPSSTSE